MKIKYYLSPSFLEKESIHRSIKKVIKEYKNQFEGKNLLDIGCGSKPYKKLFEDIKVNYKGIDFKNYSNNNSFNLDKPDYFFPKNYSFNFIIKNLKRDSFDIITSFQVLEHHKKPELFFSECKRLLKDGGFLLITFPFVWPLHEEPRDYQRLTHYKIASSAEENGFEICYINKRGGTLSVVNQIINTSFFDLKLFSYLKKIIYLLILLPLQYLCYVIEKMIPYNKNKKMFLGYTILLKKK